MKDIFSYNIDINKNAYMNWRTSKHDYISNMINIAEGFMISSIILAEKELDDNINRNADIIIFPILFNANHAIELYLKAITWTLNILLNNNRKVEGSHDIKQIFMVVCSRVDEFEKDKERKEQFLRLTTNLNNYLNELFDKISKEDANSTGKNKFNYNMDFSRYPFNQKYTNHFYIDEFDNVVVDLENFIERFKEIGENLNMIAEHYLYDFLQSDN